MAKGGFLRRIGRAIGRVFNPPPPPPPAPPPPPPPPPGPPPGGGGGPGESPDQPTNREFRDIWNDELGSRHRGFADHQDVFTALPGITSEPKDDQLDLWREYINGMVKGSENRQQFLRDVFGIDPRDFDWTGWRAGMGYKERT